MSKTLAEKWVQIFRLEGGPWPDDGYWPEQWYAIEDQMNRSGDVAACGGGAYEREDNWLGTPYIFRDNSGFLLSGGNDKDFPAIRLFSETEIAELRKTWERAEAVIFGGLEVSWLEQHVAKADDPGNH